MNTLPAMMTVAQLAALYKKLTAYSMLENALVQNLSGLPSQNFLLVMAKVGTTAMARLGQIARNKLCKYFTKVIKQHARPGILTTVEQDDGATDLKRGLMASLYNS